MPTKKQIFDACDRLHAAGLPVSERTLCVELKKHLGVGGSRRDLAKPLVEWKSEKGFVPRLAAAGLSDALYGRFGTFAKDMWVSAQSEAAAQAIAMEHNHKADITARNEVIEELLTAVEAAEAETDALRVRLAKVEKRLDRVRAEDFWDAVMREAYELIPVKGAMTAEAILSGLRPWTIRAAALQHDDLTVANLREKMKVRVGHGWYFSVDKDGAFRRGRYPGTMRRRAGAD